MASFNIRKSLRPGHKIKMLTDGKDHKKDDVLTFMTYHSKSVGLFFNKSPGTQIAVLLSNLGKTFEFLFSSALPIKQSPIIPVLPQGAQVINKTRDLPRSTIVMGDEEVNNTSGVYDFDNSPYDEYFDKYCVD